MSFDWNDIPLLLKLADTGSMSQTGRLLGAWSRSQAWICSGVEGIHNCWSIPNPVMDLSTSTPS